MAILLEKEEDTVPFPVLQTWTWPLRALKRRAQSYRSECSSWGVSPGNLTPESDLWVITRYCLLPKWCLHLDIHAERFRKQRRFFNPHSKRMLKKRPCLFYLPKNASKYVQKCDDVSWTDVEKTVITLNDSYRPRTGSSLVLSFTIFLFVSYFPLYNIVVIWEMKTLQITLETWNDMSILWELLC